MLRLQDADFICLLVEQLGIGNLKLATGNWYPSLSKKQNA
jgi:hypothetical protein